MPLPTPRTLGDYKVETFASNGGSSTGILHKPVVVPKRSRIIECGYSPDSMLAAATVMSLGVVLYSGGLSGASTQAIASTAVLDTICQPARTSVATGKTTPFPSTAVHETMLPLDSASCDMHVHSQFRPCVNGLTTFDYLQAAHAARMGELLGERARTDPRFFEIARLVKRSIERRNSL